MPIITINLLEGRTDDQKEQLIYKVTEACHLAIGVPRESVRVILAEMHKKHYAAGGVSRAKLESQ